MSQVLFQARDLVQHDTSTARIDENRQDNAIRHRKPFTKTKAMRVSSTATGGCGYACPEFPASLPEIFGPGIWWTLHTTASVYPEFADAQQRQECERFVASIPAMLPCRACGDHLRKELKQRDIGAACAGSENLSMLWCDVHNSVNARLGKPLADCTQARKRYSAVSICNAKEVFPSNNELCACSRGVDSCDSSQDQED